MEKICHSTLKKNSRNYFGSYDDEPVSVKVKLMDEFVAKNGYINDMNGDRLHHEIYLSDPRKTSSEQWKTVIRHPIKKV